LIEILLKSTKILSGTEDYFLAGIAPAAKKYQPWQLILEAKIMLPKH